MVCDAFKGSKSQENGPFHRNVWPGLNTGHFPAILKLLEPSQTIAAVKAQPHAAILHICDGVFQNSCDAGKMPAMVCDAFSNMLVILLLILEYLSYFLSDFQTIFIKMKEM